MSLDIRTHTGHIGITELRSGKVDPEKIKSAMTEVAGTLTIESNLVKQVSSIIESEGQDSSSISSNSQTLQIKRKPTISSTESQKIPTTLQPISDPMAEIVEALKMPADGKF
ncbi:1424_t:CDS:2 [Diversispora eburnea]|uniref:1424_t:CDS:1 n=1 Tax=Diversispora eburnea TaxID=1213867 RepID=A0A9N8WCC5_9GLOM|nr:1424_t:CDS:2 [Diversispora eburnea]